MPPSIFKTCALFLDKGYYSKSIPVTMNDHNYYLSYCLRQTWSSLFVLMCFGQDFCTTTYFIIQTVLGKCKKGRNKSLPLGLWLCFRIKKVYDNTEIFQ